MSVATFGHINIVTDDLETTCGFFTKYFGFKAADPVSTDADWVSKITGYCNARVTFIIMSLEDQPTRIEVLKFHNPQSPPVPEDQWQVKTLGYRHIGFTVPDIQARYETLKADGYRFLSKPVHIAEMNLWTCYFVGPEDILVQLTERH